VLVHADLLPANLLVRNGRLTAVIDLGTRRGGDPAADIAPAWHLLDRDSRRVWRAELDPDDATWTRGRDGRWSRRSVRSTITSAQTRG